MTNVKLPWSRNKQLKDESLKKPIGLVQAYVRIKNGPMEHLNYNMLWEMPFYSQVISMDYCQKSKLLVCGTDLGLMKMIEVDTKKPGTRVIKNEVEVHSARIMGISIDYKRNIIFSISEDKTLKVVAIGVGEVLSGIKLE